MSDNVANEMQFAPFDPDEVVDWAAEYDAIMQEPWLDDDEPMVDGFDWDGEMSGQGTAAVLPGDRFAEIHCLFPDTEVSTNCIVKPTDPSGLLQCSAIDDQEMQDTIVAQNEVILHNDKTPILCDVEGCHAGPYGRHAELRRHQVQKHMEPRFPCTAAGCNRTGKRAFPREDKLKDHIVAGHNDDTTFRCPYGCSQVLTRDLMTIHSSESAWQSVEKIRACPMPKCPFRVNIFGKKIYQMDDLIGHLQQEHDNKIRSKLKTLISKRGYDPASGYITCPICLPRVAHFAKHVDFYQHVLHAHMQCIQSLDADLMRLLASNRSFLMWYHFSGCDVHFQLKSWFKDTQIPDEVKEHRLALLSLWPVFRYFPIWDDVQYCG